MEDENTLRSLPILRQTAHVMESGERLVVQCRCHGRILSLRDEREKLLDNIKTMNKFIDNQTAIIAERDRQIELMKAMDKVDIGKLHGQIEDLKKSLLNYQRSNDKHIEDNRRYQHRIDELEKACEEQNERLYRVCAVAGHTPLVPRSDWKA